MQHVQYVIPAMTGTCLKNKCMIFIFVHEYRESLKCHQEDPSFNPDASEVGALGYLKYP